MGCMSRNMRPVGESETPAGFIDIQDLRELQGLVNFLDIFSLPEEAQDWIGE